MTRTEIDFLNKDGKILEVPKKKKKFISKLVLYLLIIFVILGISSGFGVITSSENLAKTLGNVSLWGQLMHLITPGAQEQKLAGEIDDRVNILLLGIGGSGHDGPYLSDTNIIVSIKPSTKQVAMISVPRDLLAPIPGYGWRKINEADSYGEIINSGQGGEFTKQVFSTVFGIPIQYYVRLDFSGFEQIVNDLNGITINVDNTFDDYEYPVPGMETATTSLRYEHLHFDKGVQHMDGATALKYVRSRHAYGVEGSDFARSRRQQKVLVAIKDKGMSFETLLNPYKISRVMDTLSQDLATNLQAWEMIKLYNLGKDIKEDEIIRQVIDGQSGYLVDGITENGAYVLKPRTGNYTEIQNLVKNIFNTFDSAPVADATNLSATLTVPKTTTIVKPTNTTTTSAEELATKAKIQVMNGTQITGLASKTSTTLKNGGYSIVKFGNAPTRDYQKTVVYNLTGNSAATDIANLINGEIANTIPNWVMATSSSPVSGQAEILVILGQDQSQ